MLWGEVKVPRDPALTFYTRNGEVFSIACAWRRSWPARCGHVADETPGEGSRPTTRERRRPERHELEPAR